jgi:hypothetical protein
MCVEGCARRSILNNGERRRKHDKRSNKKNEYEVSLSERSGKPMNQGTKTRTNKLVNLKINEG